MLANPVAGRGRHRRLISDVIETLRSSGRPCELLQAGSRAEAAVACNQAVADGAAALVALGGDGTLHLALQAVAGTPVALGVVPLGTGNDFATAVDISPEPRIAANAIAGALRNGRQTRVDLARMIDAEGDSRWFGAVLATGFDAIVNERANRMRWPKGPRRYDLAVALELARLRPRAYTLELDSEVHRFASVLVAVGNGPSYGGGMRICPDADLADGLLDIVVADPLSRVTLARLKPRLRRGTHITDPRVHCYRAREVRIDAEGIVGYADGERVGPLPLRVGCVPGALRLLR
ncbi:diacylglycerol/lipid kinase family protein [Krasilnikovia sp. M28-CT-15]|uniref:diacylglycerol/lipid kinase family protein n=1 Tax=Krasilnikovia sp. M28-CT-15 TaxID=3373540 RepID=UPI003875BE5E